MIKKVLKSPQAIIGILLIAVVLFVAIFAPFIAPNDPGLVDLTQKFLPSCDKYPLGCDSLGRCELSRLLYGATYSIGISLPILVLLAIIGLVLGSLSVCFGDKVDRALTVLCDIFISFPTLIIAIAVIGVLGKGFSNIVIAIVIAMWAWFTRMVRSYAIVEMSKDYILSARLCGCSTPKLIFHHLIPNIMPQFLVYLTTGVASSILMVSSFSFLGLGLPSGTAEWGAMLNDARSCLYSHPELLIYPGVCILVTSAGFNLFGEALRDILEPQEEGI